MSVLSFPRLYIRGTMSWDPIVSNNDPGTYDGVTAQPVFQPGETVADFRTRLIATTVQRGDWNYFGTHVCKLEDATVAGGATGPAATDRDVMVDMPVELVGKLVDLDPTGVSSQLFFDELSVGLPGGPHLHASPQRRMSSRWLNFGRNLGGLPIAGGASATWQAVFPLSDVELLRAESSPLLSQFEHALRDPRARGLMLRLCSYRTLYFQNGILNPLEPAPTLADLQRLQEQGKTVSNPAYSLITGTIGVWLDGDGEAEPGGRQLFTQFPAPVLNAVGRTARAGAATAEFDAGKALLSFDFSNTIPELDVNVEKVDFGPIAVVATKDGTDTELARIQPKSYSRTAYEATGGIVDVDLSAQQDAISSLDGGALSLRVDTPNGPVVLLAERELGASCNECNIYLDEGDTHTLVINARVRGELPTGPLSVLAARYIQTDDIVFSGTSTVLPVAADGTATLDVQAEEAGFHYYLFIAFTGDTPPDPPPSLPIDTAQFSGIRTLPFDDALAAATTDEQLTWEFVYANILITYDAIAPRMNNIINLADPDAVRTFARRLRAVTDTRLFESRRYMPVTRDLSRGKRTLLHRFCDLALTGSASLQPLATKDAAPARVAAQSQPPTPIAPGRLPGVPAEVSFDKRALS